MTAIDTSVEWWRPSPSEARSAPAVDAGSTVAFGALVAFTGILILSPQVWFPILKSLRIALVAAGVAIVAQLADRAVRPRSIDPTHPEIVLAFCLAGWAALTVPLSYWPGGSVEVLTEHFIKAIAFFWLIGTVVTSAARLKVFLWLLVLSSIPLSVTAVQNYLSGVFLQTPAGTAQRIAGYNIGGSGLTANPNDLALMINLLIPLAAALCLGSSGIVARLVAGCALLLGIVAVFMTFSRAGFLTLAGMGLVALLAALPRRPLLVMVAVLALVGAWQSMPSNYAERLSTITNISADATGSAQGRWNDLTAAVQVVVRNPLTGVGLGQNILALNQQRGETWREVHNVYLQYAVDLGITGLMLFLWLFVALLRTAGRARRQARDGGARDIAIVAGSVQIAFVAFAIAAFFHPAAYQFYFFCVGGLALAVRNVSRTVTATLPQEQAA